MSTRSALCVGVNKFHNYPGAALQGCVADANNMSLLLQKLLGFTSGDITLLTDEQATKANIVKHLKEMIAGAKANKFSYLVFSLSSHGTRVPDREGDEVDHQDEAFCPHDLAEKGGEWDRDHIIVDDELRDLFIQLPPNVLLEVYLDTCHSGTGLREIDMLLDRKPRYLSPPTAKAFYRIQGTRFRGVSHALMEKGIVHHILWAACRDDQTSADANIGGSWHGAFTYFFCKEMMACKNQLSRAQVLAKVRKDLHDAGYSQVPQLECEATKRDLGLPTPPKVAAA
ncbi:MAG: caspase family protein [Acidobacteria bacterium]|nr:caspase family protein [Acidobacteriota bacterium]